MNITKSYRSTDRGYATGIISRAARDIIFAAKHRPHRNGSGHRSQQGNYLYQEAKQAETGQRNLFKAIQLYGKAAQKGEKIDSCIKDFASVIHQIGKTKLAVNFLKDIRDFYNGDINKFDRLLNTLQRQIEPSVKHECKGLLLELPTILKPSTQLLLQMFENINRIKNTRIYNDLGFDRQSQEQGKWLILEFQSFSAAKKTLQRFRIEQWFGINKFWLKQNTILCIATDGRDDFQKGLVLYQEVLKKHLKERQIKFKLNLQEKNHWSIRILEEAEFLQTKRKEDIDFDNEFENNSKH